MTCVRGCNISGLWVWWCFRVEGYDGCVLMGLHVIMTSWAIFKPGLRRCFAFLPTKVLPLLSLLLFHSSLTMTSASGAQFVPIETLTGSPLSYEPLDCQVANFLRSEQVSRLWHTPMLEELTVDFLGIFPCVSESLCCGTVFWCFEREGHSRSYPFLWTWGSSYRIVSLSQDSSQRF